MQQLFYENKNFVRIYDTDIVIFGNRAYNRGITVNKGGK